MVCRADRGEEDNAKTITLGESRNAEGRTEQREDAEGNRGALKKKRSRLIEK